MSRDLLVRLYPAAWRARYAEEFRALLEERPLGPWDVVDIVAGAADARLRGSREWGARRYQGGPFMSNRRWGIAGMLGGVLWATGLLGVTFDPSGRPWSVPQMFAPAPWPWPFALAMLIGLGLLLAAVVGMGAALARGNPRLVWTSVVLLIVATVVAFVGVVGIQTFGKRATIQDAEALDGAWVIWSLALLAVPAASGLFALAVLRFGAVGRVAGTVLVVGSALMVATVVAGATPPINGLVKASWWLGLFFVGLLIFAAGWALLGWTYARVSPGRHPAVIRDF